MFGYVDITFWSGWRKAVPENHKGEGLNEGVCDSGTIPVNS
jgi:hypothetical protein